MPRLAVAFRSALLCLLAAACNQKSSSPAASGTPSAATNNANVAAAPSVSGFLALSDLASPPNLRQDNAEALTEELAVDVNFLNLPPLTSNGSGSGCLNQVFGKHQVQATSSGSFNVEFNEPNLTSCMQSDPGAAIFSGTYTSYTMHLQFALQCPGLDLSKYNGLSYADFLNLKDPLTCNNTSQSLTNIEITYMATVQESGGGTLSLSGTIKQAAVNDQAGPCTTTASGDAHTSSGCHTYNIVTYTYPTGIYPNNVYEEVTDDQVSGPAIAVYFASGSKNFSYNGWSGSVTYSGVSTPPTWTAQNASGQTASGTLGAATSLNLAGASGEPGFLPTLELNQQLARAVQSGRHP